MLERLHRAYEHPFAAAEAARLLHLSVPRARRLLSWLEHQGWLARIRRGHYATVPLGAESPSEWRVDPWVVAVSLFGPCYIGGWSACEHWGLTEQLFRDTVVVTTKPVRRSHVVVQGLPYLLRGARSSHLFGLRAVWRGRTRIDLSDPTRTVVDILDDPALGGGIQHVHAVVREYFASEHRDDRLLAEYVTRKGNGAVYKRLGFLTEALGIAAPALLKTCKERQSAGLASLDPSAKGKGRIVKRWNLRVNVHLASEERPA